MVPTVDAVAYWLVVAMVGGVCLGLWGYVVTLVCRALRRAHDR